MAAPFVVGFDGSGTARGAVRLTARLAAASGAPVVVAHAFAPGHDIVEARAASDELLARVGETAVRTRSIAAHTPADGLRDVARFEGAALLAVGRTHHGPVGRAFADSVPDELLHHAPCPVLVVPPEPRGPIGVVGVAYDGRPESRAAVAVARMIAADLGARVVLLGVDASDAGDFGYEQRTLHGPVAPALEQACEDGVDLLVAGSRGYGLVASVAAGSVSRHLAHHAPCPVVVVPRGRPTVAAA